MALRFPLKRGLGLSGKLLVLTILFVTLAEFLIYVPSLASFRRSWLNDRLAAAHIAALILDSPNADFHSEEMEMRILRGVGAKAVAFRSGGVRHLLAAEAVPAEVDKTVDLRDMSWQELLIGTMDDLIRGRRGIIRVVGDAPGLEFVEIVIERHPLQAEMLKFSRMFFGYSLFVSLMTAGLIYWVLQWLIVGPVRQLSHNITAFAEHPEDMSRIIVPRRSGDEIGLAEHALSGMQRTLAEELRQKRRLAELGLAISKINHELRNILTTAQLLTDRLEGITDSLVQRIAPRLVATLGRAIAFCEATLAYGRVREKEPERKVFMLGTFAEELEDLAGLAPDSGIVINADIPSDISVDADPDQLLRVLVNLVRNSVQALAGMRVEGVVPRINISASRSGRETTIIVSDNGPGIPESIRSKLFVPFQANQKKGGAGLGLAISTELVALHGGRLLLDDTEHGTSFRVIIPDRTTER